MSGLMIDPHQLRGGIRRRDAENLASTINSPTILALGFALALAACSMPTPGGVETARAFVETAVVDTEVVARRALAYHEANIRKRAAIEVEEAEVILRKALDEQKRIRNMQRAAIALLATSQAKVPSDGNRDTTPDHGSDMAAAVERVDRISAILAATDRNIETMEKTVIALQNLDIPGLH